MQQGYTQQPIPTIRQLHNQLKQSYNKLNQTFIDIGVTPLPASQDLQQKKITINKVLRQIPAQQRLQNILRNASKKTIQQHLTKYQGNYQLIKQAKNKFDHIKKQQQRIYFLAAQCNLPSVSPEFKQKITTNLQPLNSFKDVAEVKKTKNKTLEKNCISDQYLQEGEAELDCKNQPIIISARKNQQLKKLDLLIHVNFYDSHNSQKQYQFICVQQQNLSTLIQKFKCLIDTLGHLQKLRKKPQNDSQNSQIYDKFYQSSQKTSNRSHNQRQNTTNLKYLAIQDAIYYEGNQNQLQNLKTSGLNKSGKSIFRTYELQKTKIGDLRVIFGKPYLYRHLQGCDHIVIFKQARLFMGNDQFNRDILQIDKYPITVFVSKMRRKKCEGCSQMFSQIVSIGDPLKNGQNLYLCMLCHKDLHLDEHGKPKNGDTIQFINYIHD